MEACDKKSQISDFLLFEKCNICRRYFRFISKSKVIFLQKEIIEVRILDSNQSYNKQ